MRSSGIDVVQNYSYGSLASEASVTAWLDACNSAGLKAMLNITDLGRNVVYNRTSKTLTSTELSAITTYVNKFKNHGALWGWYVDDEGAAANYPISARQQVYNTIKAADPLHPVLEAHYHVESGAYSKSCHDVFCVHAGTAYDTAYVYKYDDAPATNDHGCISKTTGLVTSTAQETTALNMFGSNLSSIKTQLDVAGETDYFVLFGVFKQTSHGTMQLFAMPPVGGVTKMWQKAQANFKTSSAGWFLWQYPVFTGTTQWAEHLEGFGQTGYETQLSEVAAIASSVSSVQHDLDVILNIPAVTHDLDVILTAPTHDLDVALNLPTEHTITISKNGEGNVTPSGDVTVARGSSLSVTIAPAAGYYIDAVLVDGAEASNVLTGPDSIGKVAAYIFSDIRDNHTLEVLFAVATGQFDWTESHEDTFEYIRVDARTMEEREALIGISPGGSISENLNTSLKVSGQLEMVGDLQLDDDLVRIYLNAASDTASVRLALGTFFASTPSRTVTDTTSTATVDMYSTLLQLDEDRVEATYTVAAGTNAIIQAKSLVEASGLAVNATPSTSTTTAAAVFEVGTSKLEIINYLLDFAGYSSAYVDGMGTVMMTPYANPSTRQPVWTFEDGDNSIFLPQVTDELDWYSTPNVVVVTCSNADTVMTSVAVNDDPNSPYSTVNRGRRIVRTESVSDIETQAALDAKAQELLNTSSSSVQTETVQHTYAPFASGDVVRLNYQAAAIDYYMAVQSRELKLTPGVPITSSMRRFIRA